MEFFFRQNKKYLVVWALVFLLSLVLISCGDKNDPADENAPKEDLNNPQFVSKQAKAVLGDNVKFAYAGVFDGDTIPDISAGTEIENKDVWGIRFYLLKQSEDKFVKEYETALLEGSFNECLVQKIKFPSYKHEFVYYNSKNYFLGSGGGEIFSYIVDLNAKQCYYAHLFTEQGNPVSLFLSANIKDPQVKNFFVSNFKRDYPALVIVKKDVDLKY